MATLDENFKSIDLKANNDDFDDKNLSQLFDTGFEMYNNLNKIDEPTNSPKVQATIKQIMNIFETATKLVSLVDMFSSNESFNEIATENIKFFLLPALLGTLTTKICGTDDRLHLVDVAEVYFVDFLRRLKIYGLIDIEVPDVVHEQQTEETAIVKKKSNAELITEMVNLRNTKIQRYKEQKELEQKLDILHKNLDNPNIDDESKRDYFATLIKIFANQAIDELSSLATERPILEHIKRIGQDPESKKKPKIPSAKLQPIIITRDAVQKKVYGAGYPSLPVMTVEEFYDKKVRDGEWPEQAQRNQIGSNSLQDVASGKVDESLQEDKENEEKEELVEKDDQETLDRARAMDEYKDEHRRGWGNRANRS